MYIGVHVRYPLFLSDFNESWIFSTDFQKYSNIKCNENTSNGTWVFPCGWKDEWTWRSRQSLSEIFRMHLKLLFRNRYIFYPVAKSNRSLSIFEVNISRIQILNYVTPICYYLLPVNISLNQTIKFQPAFFVLKETTFSEDWFWKRCKEIMVL
jgi:hypothetical protein